MTITISPQDPRSLEAVEIAAEAGRWAKCRTRDGRTFYPVPSQHHANMRYLADLNTCSCPDLQRHRQACKHVLAIACTAPGSRPGHSAAERRWSLSPSRTRSGPDANGQPR